MVLSWAEVAAVVAVLDGARAAALIRFRRPRPVWWVAPALPVGLFGGG